MAYGAKYLEGRMVGSLLRWNKHPNLCWCRRRVEEKIVVVSNLDHLASLISKECHVFLRRNRGRNKAQLSAGSEPRSSRPVAWSFDSTSKSESSDKSQGSWKIQLLSPSIKRCRKKLLGTNFQSDFASLRRNYNQLHFKVFAATQNNSIYCRRVFLCVCSTVCCCNTSLASGLNFETCSIEDAQGLAASLLRT